MRVVEKINKVLERLMNKNKDLYIVGEDILDPYGGAFKVTKGLSTKFKDRVFIIHFNDIIKKRSKLMRFLCNKFSINYDRKLMFPTFNGELSAVSFFL